MLNKVKDFFLEKPPIRYEGCIYCGKKLKKKQRKFCSNKCNYRYHNTIRSGRDVYTVERRLKR